MSSSDDPPLSLRPLPVADQRPKNLVDFVTRVNTQPGGFRSVTEAKLIDEIKASEGQDGAVKPEDEDMSSSAEEEDRTATKDPHMARMEVLRDVELAGNSALLTLDSMSLLLSKQNPTQAGVTLSQQLRELVGIGTMGMDKLHDSNTTPAKTQDRETIAVGWTLMETSKTRDAAEEATTFLAKEIEAEGRYWEDIISVHKAGWSICRVPLERHTLGVRFGFSEAAPEFKNNGLAPLRRGDDGLTQLDVGRLGGVSEALVVTYERDGQVVGRSSLRGAADNKSLESRVLEARNTIFSQELWHELLRESRSLLAYDVRPQGSRLVYTVSATDRLIFELLPVGASLPASNEGLLENKMAESISMALHILLSYAHRYNELIRIRPMPPHVPRSRGQQPYALLRPIIARTMALRNAEFVTTYIGKLVQALRRAGLPTSFVLRTPQATPSDPNSRGPNQPSGSQTLVRNMLQCHECAINLTIVPDVSLTVRGRSFIFPVTATYYYILLPPNSPLSTICPPYSEGYTDQKALTDYLHIATARVLTAHFLAVLRASYNEDDFIQGIQGNSIRDVKKEALDIRFSVNGDGGGPSGVPSLVFACISLVDGKPDSKRWEWTSTAGETRPLDDMVRLVADQALS